jgi:HK97 family phage major capsid protein
MPANIISREDAEALIPTEVSPEIISGAIQESIVLSNFRRLPNMASNSQSMPVLSSLPTSYWVDGDTGQKQTTNVQWKNKHIKAEELAVIVPIPEAVLDDARTNGYDIWAEIRPLIEQSLGKAIDEAILFGTNRPHSWRDGIVQTAQNTGTVLHGTGDVYNDIMGADGAIAMVEKSGFMPTGVLSSVSMRGKLRGLKNDAGQPIFSPSMQEGTNYALDGMPMHFVLNGSWDETTASLIVGDMSQGVYAIRQDITYKVLTESVIQNTDGTIAYNLAQQDMVALRVVMRLGWELPNPVTSINQGDDRFPFAVYLDSNAFRQGFNNDIIATTETIAKQNQNETTTETKEKKK